MKNTNRCKAGTSGRAPQVTYPFFSALLMLLGLLVRLQQCLARRKAAIAFIDHALLALVECFAWRRRPFPSSIMHLAAAGTVDATVPMNMSTPRPLSTAA
jgi:hypothetical protein